MPKLVDREIELKLFYENSGIVGAVGVFERSGGLLGASVVDDMFRRLEEKNRPPLYVTDARTLVVVPHSLGLAYRFSLEPETVAKMANLRRQMVGDVCNISGCVGRVKLEEVGKNGQSTELVGLCISTSNFIPRAISEGLFTYSDWMV